VGADRATICGPPAPSRRSAIHRMVCRSAWKSSDPILRITRRTPLRNGTRVRGLRPTARLCQLIFRKRAQPRYRRNADSNAVMPISPAAQKFHRFIRRSAFDNSVSSSECSLLSLMWGIRHIADRNQNTAEPHVVTIMAVSIGDFIITPDSSGVHRYYTVDLNCRMIIDYVRIILRMCTKSADGRLAAKNDSYLI